MTDNPFAADYVEPAPEPETDVFGLRPIPSEGGAKKGNVVIHRGVEQGSQRWFDLRCGILTASEMKYVISSPPKEETRIKKNGEPYKQREWEPFADNDDCRTHLYELAAQRMTKCVEPIFESYDMLRGKAEEQEARGLYSDRFGKVEEVGFITNDRHGFVLGYSPDGLVGDDGLIECKSRKQKYQVQTVIEHLQTGGIPQEFVIQHQTGLFVSERKWIDFVSFSAKLPMAVIRVHPDDKLQSAIREVAEISEAKIAKVIADFREATAS